MKSFSHIPLTISAILLITASSCEKMVEIGLPKNQITTTDVFSDSTNADAAILGIYINMMQAVSLGFCSGGITAYPGLSADELYQSTNDINLEFHNNTVSTNNSTLLTMWTAAYRYIYETNACIEGIQNSETILDHQKSALVGEAKCIRAFLYFYLVNMFGPVPLVLNTDYQSNRLLYRISEDEIYSQIIADLISAQTSLINRPEDNTRVGYYTATALLSRIYLYNHDFNEAKDQATIVINSGRYNLMSDLNDIFTTSSKETIWGLLPVYPNRETWEGYYFIPSSTTATPRFIISEHLYNAIDPIDKRKQSWINTTEIADQVYPYPYKYKKSSTTSNPTEQYVVLRLSEQYLIRSEAEANLGEIEDAQNDLNSIRARAGLPNIQNVDGNELLIAIEKERQIELMCEWGHRWFDLKRTGRATGILPPLKENWKETALLFPIPQSEINNNPNLTQNPSY